MMISIVSDLKDRNEYTLKDVIILLSSLHICVRAQVSNRN